ncbi:hypothetical protein NC653_003783 [Populus alba x Populus x berolinensis]|uniref:Uncharacterized protein n=1 Tax=Populus alba x Populus x berolinensis TaxID=444605 RepID=A0AAD6RSK6_9ROSI|nr:hypothetical protein NC653_003783 [Populus alba x Populus x berolinensis]
MILGTMLGCQRCVFNKKRLGYQPKRKQKYLKNYFVKAKQSHNSDHGSFDLYMFY